MANILIIGDGAIGLLLSHFLSKAHTVHVLTRKATANTRFYCKAKQPSQKINARFITLKQINEQPAFDIVIFAVKAFQVQSAFTQIKPFLSPSSVLIVSHNGMGNVETLNEQLDKQQALYFLTTSMAGFKTNDFIVQHTGEGKSVLGACNPCAHSYRQAMCEQLQNVPQLSYSTNIEQLRFEKLLVNIAINPLSALYDIKNGQLRAPYFNSIIFNLLTEACQIAHALKLDIKLADALNNAYNVMMLTAENYSSMHQDVAHNRQTEIDAICGYISQQGKRLNISTPLNDALLAKIKAKKSVV
ncbi:MULTISPECIES: ketopantoate reductase family protein [unclassified Pseudoalteromonas]|jgi:2-dehydropantoate 2-reductase|uniref:ketopantoate reductase family protein n=1 Tax=unclassified Pseudoalteromonas TaxID=194690 RepID=UPI000EDFFB2D|nr:MULTISPECIES: 2-dehydropantoate 2-reductase [unclassified Pseudoalteromonas]HAG40480.1 2-dehydropantoate 2-reductase [Pseudoalteromonas sp.]MDC9500253.1 2-dehydropantoate 2-reductase [Pseudoalteromonas sp. Angola-18]MDC9528779.1 2-dehydropantoate 2-reductase [Pseudoalteromonas sp. Angola-7]TMO04532.1 2-dehydropantoate 2-reductase [Pseudoalteromonas sp. S327]TMO17685.1 2-dehydropantoate 2-reductase [Pseudoalteromonas sp. S326]|tara:strand:+ start:670 stop:1572 length:903 start_codon:yes stop_codon:yes gene_type:complete